MSTMRDLKERGLLERFGPMLRRHTEGLPLGTGDDVAITPDGYVWTIDTMVEGTHFLWYDDPLCTGAAIAAKLVASNVSDLCSKGAMPRFALLSFGVPPTAPVERIASFYEGLDAELRRHGLVLLGGDTVGAPQWTLTLTVVGELPLARLPIAARHAAAPGMAIYATGWPGESGAGFELLQGPDVALEAGTRAHLVRRHLSPEVHPSLGRRLVESLGPLAMIDLSDGLAKDSGEIANASGVAVILEKLPISPMLRSAADALRRAPEHFVLFGGEDYELLFCTAAGDDAVRRACEGHVVHRVGAIEVGSGVWLRRCEGLVPVEKGAFDHFR